jgi:aspartyl-tRNA(Asn)/glutamyl-tRNA(Gln) amidotransferase subunit B
MTAAAGSIAERAAADYFEKVAAGRDGKLAANWVINELFGALSRRGLEIDACPLPAEALGELLDLLAEGTISGKIAKDVFQKAFETGRGPREIVEAEGLRQVVDAGAIEPVVARLVAENPQQVENAKKNPKVVGWFVGQVMKATGGKANPGLVNDLVRKALGLE